MNKIAEIFTSLDYGPAPEAADVALAWLKAHDNRFGLFIDGTWTKPGKTFATDNPATGNKLADLTEATPEDVDVAVKAARAAFPKWSALSGYARAKHLYALARLIQKHARLFAVLETMDNGKPIRESRDVDIPLVARHFYHHAGWAQHLEREFPGHVPHGVCGQIIPWNFPLLMLAWKIAPALAAGNSVVLKPSEKSPLTALRLAELALEAGLPPGVLNVVPGYGLEAGSPLALHMDVDCIAFTGSTRVGKQIHVMAGQSNLKRAWTELGGKSPNIVFADCPDLDEAVEAAVGNIFFNQGESCNAPSRLFVEAGIREQFLEKALALVPGYMPANPLAPDTVMGAIVDQTQMNSVLRYIELGKQEGAALLAGGEQALLDTGGCYVQPTIFAGVTPDMTIAREEIFGPVLSVLSFTDTAEVVRQANQSIYGLQAAVWTRDINKAHGVARALKAGTVHVNQYDEDDITVPFGGYKQSGVGRDKSLHAFDKYT
ncbi:MAG: aldehyde dehydrogenase, partial [Rhodoferax sp.]|uniref:aldehyde dehydrogenase n=1 Tax=Rhodoferax sp. TaxID=50421 RepID=UPI0027366A89